MIKRTITGVFITALVYIIICFSHITPLLYVATAFLSMSAVYEIYHVIGFDKNKQTLIGSMGAAGIISLLPIPQYEYLSNAVFVLAVVVFIILMASMDSYRFTSTKQAAIVAFLIVLLFKAIPALRAIEHGLYYLTFATTICFITDVFAFLFGKVFGAHKLAPRISPGKTVEGAIGGIVCSAFVAVIIMLVLETHMQLLFDRWSFLAYVVLTSIIGQFGDLSMSVIKRICGAKDYSNLLPGHGGVLDRFDSHLFAVPFTLIFCVITGGFIY